MTIEELEACFERHDDEYLQFGRIEKPAHRRPDVCAFIMLDAVVPEEVNRSGNYGDMVAGAEHDEIYLDIGLEEFAKVATDELVRDLHRCGVRFSSEFSCLAMFT